MSDEGSGSWLPSGRVAEACRRCLEGIETGREEARVNEAERIVPARWWRPWRLPMDVALRKVAKGGFAQFWWEDEQIRTRRILILAQAVEPRRSVFVSARDFKAFAHCY